MALGQVLVTGASGFVGGHLVDRALGRGLRPVAAAGDLRRPEVARRAVAQAGPSGVVHLASAAAPGTVGALADDALMAANVLAAVADIAPETPVLVAGSAAQYGMGSTHPMPEDHALAPVGAYGASKLALERACLSHRPPRVIWARSFNHVGPSQPVTAPVAAWARQVAEAERGGAARVRTGRLDVVRDLLDVRDVADAYLALLESAAEGPVNVCSGRPLALSAVIDRLAALSTAEVTVELDPALVRAVDPPCVVGDPARLHALTGWRPAIDLEESLLDVLEEWRGRARGVESGLERPAAVGR